MLVITIFWKWCDNCITTLSSKDILRVGANVHKEDTFPLFQGLCMHRWKQPSYSSRPQWMCPGCRRDLKHNCTSKKVVLVDHQQSGKHILSTGMWKPPMQSMLNTYETNLLVRDQLKSASSWQLSPHPCHSPHGRCKCLPKALSPKLLRNCARAFNWFKMVQNPKKKIYWLPIHQTLKIGTLKSVTQKSFWRLCKGNATSCWEDDIHDPEETGWFCCEISIHRSSITIILLYLKYWSFSLIFEETPLAS